MNPSNLDKGQRIVNSRLMLCLLVCYTFAMSLSAQNEHFFDSLRMEMRMAKSIHEQLRLKNELAFYYVGINADSVNFYARSAIQQAIQTNDKEILCWAYQRIASWFECFPETQNLDSVMHYRQLSYQLSNELNDDYAVIECKLSIGLTKMKIGDCEGAIIDIVDVKNRYISLKDSTESYLVDYYLAQAYGMSGDFKRELSIYESIINSNVTLESYLYPIIYEEMGTAHQNVKNFSQCLIHYQKAYELLKTNGNEYDMRRIHMKLARAFQNLGNEDSSNYHLNKCISYADSCVGNDQVINSVVLGDVYMDRMQYDDAEIIYLQSLSDVRKMRWIASEKNLLYKLFTLYQIKTDYAKAINYLQQYKQLNDSLKIDKFGYMINEAMSDQELADKKAELIQLYEAQVGMVRRNQLIVVFFAIVLLLSLISWYFQSRLLFRFASHAGADVQLWWKYSPPAVMLTKWQSGFSALGFVVISTLCYFLLLPGQANVSFAMYWTIISFVFYFCEDHLFFNSLINKRKALFVELMHLLFGISLIIIMLTAVAALLEGIKFDLDLMIHFALLITTCYLGVKSIESMMIYYWRLSIISIKWIETLNHRLMEWKESSKMASSITSVSNQTPLVVDSGGQKIEIQQQNLLYVVSDNVYQEFFMIDGDRIIKALVRSTLGAIEQSLRDYPQFFRCHRSYIVNTQKISAIEGNLRQYSIVLEHTNVKLPLSRNVAEQLFDQMNSKRN